MHRLHGLLLLIAACGGSAAPAPTTPTSSSSTGAEDWRGYLGQLAGSPCNWIPGASFLACIEPANEPTTTLVGWESNNRRYVAWRISRDGKVSVMPGSAANAGWLFESPDGTITFTREPDNAWLATGLAASNVIQMPSPKAQPPAGADAPATSEDWRSSLEPFTGQWAFSGTLRGADANAEVTCKWIAAATFVACKTANRDGFELIGWEPHNARYVMWRFTPTAVDVMVGTRTNKDWTFASPTHRTTFGWESAIRRNYKDEELAGGSTVVVAEGALDTSVE